MRKLYIILLISFTLVNSYSFGFNDGDSLRVKNNQPLRIGFNAGVGMGSMGSPFGKAYFFNSFYEATGTYALSPKSGLLFGLGFNRFNLNSPFFNSEVSENQTHFLNQYLISAGGYHHVNDRLTLTGMAEFSVPVNGGFSGNMFNPFGNSKNLDFNAYYKISDKVSIGAGFRYSEGNPGYGFGNGVMNPIMPFRNTYGRPYGW